MHFIKSHLLKKRYILPSITAAIALAGAGVAYAYFTSTGTGTGTAQVGTASNWVIKSTGPTGNLYPDLAIGGANIQSVPYSVTNPGQGDQNLTSVTISVANSDGSAWSSVSNSADPPCTAADFSIGGNAVGTPFVDSSLGGTYTAGQTKNGTVSIEMIDNGDNQDNCQDAVIPLYFSVGTAANPDLSIDPSPNGGSGGFYPNPTYLTVPSVPVGTAVELTVTAIQPNTENSDGTYTLTYDNADLTFTGASSDATCSSVTTTGTSSTVSCSYTDLGHSDASKPFDFTTKAIGETFVQTQVSISGSGTATETFGLDITA